MTRHRRAAGTFIEGCRDRDRAIAFGEAASDKPSRHTRL
jgi:hypothetical protein